MDVTFEGRTIGPDHPPLVIPEVGINHEGDVAKALEMVDAVADAGGEVVKFQCHITDKEMIPTDMKPGDISDESLWDIIKRCELTADEELRVQQHCRDRGLIYLSTPFSREAADRLNEMGVPAFKIGSGECNNLPLIDHIAAMGRPMLISTGMNDLASVQTSLAVIAKHDVPVAVFHCTSMYPTPHDKVRLGAVTELQSAFPGVPVGLSDHSLGLWTCLGAVALGACVVEKHFTMTRDWPGPDIGISIEPDELRDLIVGTRAIWEARGGGKTILPDEQPVIDFAYASVVTTAAVRKGAVFDRTNTWVKRPGTGPLLSDRFDDVLGKTATRDLEAEVQIAAADVAGLND
ncbi:MAG: polyhydroxyalkanoate biosynthesis repressor PhaR [Alphaproteobacteria bacterium]|nr:polyhydroxyalkanoate biosynthesis repressor PhaR [Alphaproteobacteria bacterium]MBT5859769.1 polyhydroxyalkanoate biosynthesis repressor PhaR [Alphaproteobacteria bacterium]